MAESYPGFAIDTWWGLVAPAGTPPDMLAKFNAAFTSALRQTATRERFSTLMAEPTPTTPDQFGAFMRTERAKYQSVVKASGAKVD